VDDALETARRVNGLFKQMGQMGLTLSVAESCTGGLISRYLSAVPGAGEVFRAGVVAYSAEMKQKLLGVSSGTISRHGVVSEETAREMAERMRALAGTDYSLSSTGNLGPDVLEGKEKGLVYIAASREGKTISRELRLTGDRGENKERASREAMKLLLETAGGG
jgi:PncC family amidohydrolase